MLRTFVGTLAGSGAPAAAGRLQAALAGEGEAHELAAGPLAVAYTGPELPRPAADAPICLVDGTVYELIGLEAPARRGPELERWLAEAYRDQGERLLARLRGDFALLLFDPSSAQGLLVRDQLGGRSVVWHASGGQVSFASDCRPLLRALPRRPEPDPVAVAHWLAVSGMPGDRSLYAGVRRVEAGCAVRLGGGGGAPFRYWSPEPARTRRAERSDHAAALRTALERAVARRLVAGERVAALVSGGLDSGSIAAVAANAPEERRLRSVYSATFPRHPSVDESELIAELCSQLGLRSTTIKVYGGSVLQGALAYLRRFELPPVSPNLFFWLPLQQRAAEDGVEVMLDGEGGDELFGGSPALLADRLRRGRLLASLGLLRRLPGSGGRPSRHKLSFYLRTYGLKGAVPYRLHTAVRRRRDPSRYAPAWMLPGPAADYAASDDEHDWKLTRGPRWFANQLHNVARGMGPALAYEHIRRRSALAGIEPRHPLIDVDVVELVMQLPPELPFDPRHSRPLLREAMAGLLPDAVRLRPTKSNFDAVFHEALAGPDLPAARALLGRPDAEVGAYVDRHKLAELLAGPPDDRHGRMWWALHVWRLLTAECWLIAQSDPERIDSLLGGPLEQPRIELSPPPSTVVVDSSAKGN
jgi:asparagine synthase (glutamine-hydrolysing)